MAKDKPDYQDAELTLRLYELRREAVMRESRNTINSKFWPKSYQDVVELTNPEHPMNAAFRQVTSYWEMVYGFARHGITPADFLVENNGEGLFLYVKIQPFIEQIRKDFNPLAFQNTEWLVKNSPAAQTALERIQGFIKRLTENK
ncbi:MAG: hypothetical protein AB1489_24375 [Acidobacteriota bacterium]